MILVTGAAGFIGRHLVAALNSSPLYVPSYAIDIAPLASVPCKGSVTDITDDAAMAALVPELQGRVTACVHLAAVASPPIAAKDPATAWATNVHGTHNVLQLCHRIGCKRVVFFSSAHVYGISPRYFPTDENHPLALLDTYTTTKIMGEQLCDQFYRYHGLSYAVLRLWNAYGPGQNKDYFIGAKLRQAGEGKLTLRNGSVTKDWVSVHDVVRATIAALSSGYVGPLNVGTGIETSLETIVTRLSEHFGIPVELENVANDGPTRMRCDWSRIQRTLGWEPTVSFADGLAELIGEERKGAA